MAIYCNTLEGNMQYSDDPYCFTPSTCYLAASLLIIAINFIVVPSEPHSLAVYSVTSSSETLQWVPPELPNGVITQYSIQHNGTDVTNFNNNTLMDTIEGLSPDTVYDVQLRAHTVVGPGSPASINFLTCKLLNIRILSYACSTHVMQV